MDKSKLRRSNNRMIGGVCAGIAEYFGWDVTLVRVIYALITFFSVGFPGVLAYIILWALIPAKSLRG